MKKRRARGLGVMGHMGHLRVTLFLACARTGGAGHPGSEHAEDAVPVHSLAWFAALGEFDFAFAVAALADDDGAASGDVEIGPVEAVSLGDLAVQVAEERLGVGFLFGPCFVGEHGIAGDAHNGCALGAPLGEVTADALHFGGADACEGEGVEAEDNVALLDCVGELEVLAVLGGEGEVGGDFADGEG